MLTIFSVPKAFRGQFHRIQRDAIRSWTLLRPKPEILLIGDDEGTGDVCRQFGVHHLPEIRRNAHGTPLASSVFVVGEHAASNETVAYVNADIVLGGDFSRMVARATEVFCDEPFLAIGRKLSVPLVTNISFGHPDWDDQLRRVACQSGVYVTYDSDFFVYRRPLFHEIPPFALGRCYWTQWLIDHARRRGIPVIDVTSVVACVEPRHDYSHARSTGGAARLSGEEFRTNRRLFRGHRYLTTLDSTHIMTPEALVGRPGLYRLLSAAVRVDYWIYFLLKAVLYPYSLPLILAGRAARKVARALLSNAALRKATVG